MSYSVLFAKYMAQLEVLRLFDPHSVLTCIVCSGKAPDPQHCGCGGTCTAADAIAYLECELEILAK